MAKNTHSQEVLTGTSDSFTNHEITDPNPPYQIQRAMLGELVEREGDEQLAGMDYLESSENEPKLSGHSKATPRGLARTMENPSDQTDRDQEGSSAPSMGGAGLGTARPRSGRKTQTRSRANVRATGDDEDEFSEFE